MKNVHNKGFTIFFALLVVGLVLGVGVSISSLSQKQIVLSYFSKQSQAAFYAADTGGECARFWDIKNPDNPGESKFLSYNGSTSISCGNQSIVVNRIAGTEPELFISNFKIALKNTNLSSIDSVYSYCADVTVTKNLQTGETQIASRGHNLDCNAPVSARKVERAIAITY
ncbi:MAG: hypothetical protein V4519_01105 [Patescibacteria group bacterium]